MIWEKLARLLHLSKSAQSLKLDGKIRQTQQIGDWAESKAEQYLLQQGLRTKQKNYRCKAGEIDIVMNDQKALVFVEVRTRKHQDFGTALESVNRIKQQRLIRAAKHYLQSKKLTDKIPCRFDVVSVGHTEGDDQIQWITNAFSA